MERKKRIRLILNISTLFVCVFLLISTMFAWYTSNKNVSANGISASTDNSNAIIIEPTITTVRHNLNKDTIESVYSMDDNGSLWLKSYIKKDKDSVVLENQNDPKDNNGNSIPFRIEEMLPGEYIDITFGFYLKEEYDNTAFKIKLMNISGGSFVVDEYTHYVSGAFKYKNISLVDKNETFSKKYSDANYIWLNSYKINESDQNNIEMTILNETWKNSYGVLYYTFRIYEDFTQYYNLIAQAQKSYGALLSNKDLSIGQIYFMLG